MEAAIRLRNRYDVLDAQRNLQLPESGHTYCVKQPFGPRCPSRGETKAS